ncbi:MAG: sulfatase/phosphatase domain-containing protein, partial [Candidatus Binatia bacterium]
GRLLHSQYFEEVARIPLLFRVPRASVRPRTIPDLASTLDTMPTILDLLGLKPNPEARGRSLLPLMMGDPLPAQPVLISWRKEKLRNQGWSLIVANGDATDLYDLTNDPGERVNVIAEHAAATDDLLANFRRMRTAELEHKMMLQTVPNPETEMTSEEVEKLRALGYVN